MKRIILATAVELALAMPLAMALTPPRDPASLKASSPPVRNVAAHPSAYVGPLTLEGVVGVVNPGKGFVLVDIKEYRQEGFNCLTTDEPTKISVRWTGAAPKVRQTVRVQGQLARTKSGYAFTAVKVGRQ